MIYDVLNSTPIPCRKGPLTALESVPFHGTHGGWGPGEALNLPQRVRAEPGRQTFFGILWSENEVWEAPKLSQQVRVEPGRQTCILT